MRLTRIQGRHQRLGPNFSSINSEWVFLSKARPHFAQRSAHFFLRLMIDEIHQWCVFISVDWPEIERSAVALLHLGVPPRNGAIPAGANKLARIAQERLRRHILREFRAQKPLVRSILEEPSNQV